MHGFSPRNLLFMRSFAEAYPDATIVKQLVSQLPWGQVIRLLQRVKEPAAREWYARQPIGVADWETRLLQSLPDELRASLPTVEEIEAELAGEVRPAMRMRRPPR